MRFAHIFGLLLIIIFLTACGDNTTEISRDADDAALLGDQTGSLPSVDEDVEIVTFADEEESLDSSNDTNVGNAGQPSALATAPAIEFAGLGEGVSRDMARATDVVMVPEIEERMTFDESPVPITFSEFYDGFDIRTGLKLSEKLRSLDGQQVIMEGYVAPPLKPRLDFFVLTRIQLAFCPFCSSDVEWPTDIALIYLPETQTISSEFPVRVMGQMEIGSSTDAETGMVSIVRIYAETIEIIR